MSAPNLGPCQCDDVLTDGLGGHIGYSQHEHSDFEPYPCADCGCAAHRPAGGGPAESPSDAPGARTPLTLPAELGFARQRVTQAAQWLDQVLSGIYETTPRDPDDPLAVCGLADILEQANTQAGIDPYDALALMVRRRMVAQHAGPQRARGVRRLASAAMSACRRKGEFG